MKNTVSSIALSLVAAAALAENAGWDWDFGSGITFDEKPIVKFNASATYKNCGMTYGIVGNEDPVFVLNQDLDFFNLLSVGFEEDFDTTYIKRDHGCAQDYKWRRTEFDVTAKLHYGFDVGTTLYTALGYKFAYQPRVLGGNAHESDTLQAWIGLPDLWLSPMLFWERSLDSANNDYLQLSVGHSFQLCDSLSLTISAAQGWVSRKYVSDDAGLADSSLSGALAWTLAKGVSLTGWVTGSDYLFNPHGKSRVRRELSGTGHSWAVQAGVTFAVAF